MQEESLQDASPDAHKVRARERLQAKWQALPDPEKEAFKKAQWDQKFPQPKDRTSREWRPAVLEAISALGRRLLVRFVDAPHTRMSVSVFEVRVLSS